jgi:hypothetical protein
MAFFEKKSIKMASIIFLIAGLILACSGDIISEDNNGNNPDVPAKKVLILQAYGSSATAAGVSHSFVELYNATDKTIPLSGYTLHYADGIRGTGITQDAPWKTIPLTGTIPAKASYLILGPRQSSTARYQIADNYGDINNSNFTLSNRSFKVALIYGTDSLSVQNPFNTNGKRAKVDGYIDMVGAANDLTASNPDNIFGYETAPARNFASEAVRRKNLIDTDNNSIDFIAARYAVDGLTDEEVELRRPRNTSAGSWEPFETAPGPYAPASIDALFNPDSVSTIIAKISVEEWNKLLSNFSINSLNKESHRVDEFIYNDGEGNSFTWPDVSIRIRGNTSRRVPEVTNNNQHNPNNPRWQSAHFKFHFHRRWDHLSSTVNEVYRNRRFGGRYRSINTKWFKEEPMFVRELYSYNLFNKFGIWTAAKVKYVKMYIQVGNMIKPAYFGPYIMFEDFGDDYITERVKRKIDPDGSKGIGFENNSGYLWKCSWKNGVGPSLENIANIDNHIGVEDITLTYTHEFTYDLSSNDTQLIAARTQLKKFIQDLNSKTGTDFKTWIDSVMDIDIFLKTLAVEVALGHWDNYWVNINNYYLYFDNISATDYKVYLLPYDLDNTLGISHLVSNSGTQDPLNWGTRNTGQRALVTKVLNIPEYEAKYKQYLRELANPENDLLHVDRSVPRINAWHNLIMNDLNSDIREGVGSMTYNAFDDRAAPTWANQPNYKLLTGNDSTNFFRAKVASIGLMP